MVSDVTPVDPNFRVTKKVLDGLSQLVSVAENIGSIGRSFNDLAYFVNTTHVDAAKKDQDQLVLGLESSFEKVDNGFSKMFKKSGTDICFDKLMTHEKRVARAQKALLGMIKNAVGDKPGLPLNKTLNSKG